MKENSYSLTMRNDENLADLIHLHRVETTLLYLGIMPNHLGFEQLRNAIALKRGDSANKNMREIYKELSLSHNINLSCIERNIRTAILYAYNSGALIKINELLGAEIMKANYCLTNLQLISLVVKYLNDTNYYTGKNDNFSYAHRDSL